MATSDLLCKLIAYNNKNEKKNRSLTSKNICKHASADTIKDHTCMHNDMHNPYVVRTGVFDWNRLKDKNPDLPDNILARAGSRIELTWDKQRRLPDSLRPPGMPEEKQSHPLTKQKLVIERSRRSIRGHGPLDSLTVTLSERVNRYDYDFQYAEEQGWPFDKHKVFAAMDNTQTWTNVKKIKLICPGESNPRLRGVNAAYHMQLVRGGAHVTKEIVTIPDSQLSIYEHLKNNIAQRLTEGLQLHHAVVGGVDEYSV